MTLKTIDLGQHPVLLAPMEDVTDVGFRLLCRQMGAAMVYSEFVAAEALVRGVGRTLQKIEVCDEERPVGIQIYGRDPGAVAEAAQIVVEQARPDVLDLNFGCPVKRVAGKGAGAGMLQDIPQMMAITRAVVDAVGDRVPVTAKTRIGWDIPGLWLDAEHRHPFIVDVAEQLQDCGIAALTLHGRTRSQMYTGEADWDFIGAVKANPRMHIPIIGNGDITSAQRAKECFDRYGVDAVMVGRATFGRPWIFREITSYLQTGEEPALGNAWKMDILKEQVRQSVARLDERRGILHIRRHLAASPLFKGIPDFRPTRIAMLRAETVDDLMHIMDEITEKFEPLELLNP